MEIQFLNWLDLLRNPVLDSLMVFVTSLGDGGIFWILTAVLLLWMPKRRSYGIAMLCAMVMGLIVVNLGVKPLVGRIRPYEAVGYGPLLIKAPSDASFPSGHTQVSVESAWILAGMNKKVGMGALILAVLIAFSRMYLYVHYPSDVAGGFLFGSLWAYLSLKYVRPMICRRWKLE